MFAGIDSAGRKRYISRTVHGTKRQAQAVLNELLVEVDQGSANPDDGTFADLAERWMEMAEAELSPTTLSEYRRLLDKRILPKFGRKRVRDIRSDELDAFYAVLLKRGGVGGESLSAQSVRLVHALIRRLLNQAVRWGWIAFNPAQRATQPRRRVPDLGIPAPEAVGRILSAAADQDSDLALFLRLSVVTGARRGEICALKWSDLDVKASTLTISRSIVDGRNDELIEKGTKTHASRRVSLDPATLEELRIHRERCEEWADACGATLPNNAYLFAQEPDGVAPWRPNRVTLAFGRLVKDLGITGVRLHDLRHFAATQMLAAGVPVKTVSSRLGHANAATTLNVYAHALTESDERAANVLAALLEPSST